MRKEYIFYLIERPFFTISFILSAIPILYVVFYAINKELDLLATFIFITILFLAKVDIYADSFKMNPFLLLLNTFIKRVTNFALSLAFFVFVVFLTFFIAIKESTIVIVIGILLMAILVVIIIFGSGSLLRKLLGIMTVEERRSIIGSIFYNMLWVLVLITDDIFMFILGLLISIYWNMILEFKNISKGLV